MEILSYDMSGIRILRLRGHLEEADVAGFMSQVYPDLLGRQGIFLLNLEKMEKISAYGLAVLHDLLRKLGREGSLVGLVVAPSLAEDWATLMGEGQVGLYPSEMEGIQALTSLQARSQKRAGPGFQDPHRPGDVLDPGSEGP